MTPSEGWIDGLNTPNIITTPRKVFDGPKLAVWLWHKDINDVRLTLVFTPPSAYPAHQFLGMIIHHTDTSISVCQTVYVNTIFG